MSKALRERMLTSILTLHAMYQLLGSREVGEGDSVHFAKKALIQIMDGSWSSYRDKTLRQLEREGFIEVLVKYPNKSFIGLTEKGMNSVISIYQPTESQVIVSPRYTQTRMEF